MAFDFRRAARSMFPFFPPALLDIFVKAWTETGDPELAITETRQSPIYQDFFPGNLRDDGTVRLTEHDYNAEHEAFRLELAGYGIEPSTLEHIFPQLVEAGVHSNDFRARMTTVFTDIASNLQEVQDFYARAHGIDDLSLPALMASALDPGTSPAVFQQRIREAQIGGEGAIAGFNVDMQLVSRLAAAGLTQEASRQFFTQASTLLPNLNTLLERHRDPDDEFTLDELGEALILGDPAQRRQIERLFAQERSQFTPLGLFQIRQGGVVEGLRQQ